MNLTASKNSPAPPPRRTPTFPPTPAPRRRLHFRVPMTPLLRWKLDDPRHGSRGRIRVQSQARKLAAGLWQLHYREISAADGGCRRRSQVEIRNGDGVGAEQRLQRRGCSNNGIKIKAAVKEYWSPETPEKAEAAAAAAAGSGRFYSHRSGGGQPHTAASATSDLQKELATAQKQIRKLKSQQQNSKKKIQHLKEKLEENRAMWKKNQKHSKLNELDQQTKTHYRTETLNAKLAKEVAETKEKVKKYKQEYEKERKNRELLEEVCTEMANEIMGDRAKVEALKRESMKLCEELEEEKNMLQMAEVWREERIQMKLIDAKLALEDKYIQMNKLINELEIFLMSRSEKLDEIEVKRAESIHRAAKSLDIDEIDGFFYEPEKQSLVLSLVHDELHENGCVYERKMELFENPLDDSLKKKVNVDECSEGGELKCADSVSQKNLENPHIKRGTNGCIEWPRGIQKNCFKAKTLDARIQSQKSQLRHVLKHNELNVVLKKKA